MVRAALTLASRRHSHKITLAIRQNGTARFARKKLTKNGDGHRLDTAAGHFERRGRRRARLRPGTFAAAERRRTAEKKVALLQRDLGRLGAYLRMGRTRSAFRTRRRSSLLLRGLSHTRTASRSGASFPSGLRSVGAKNGYPSADGNLFLARCAARPAFVSVGRVRPDILRHSASHDSSGAYT